MNNLGELIGYTGEDCPNCGRNRVEVWTCGKRICEKCHWCIEDGTYCREHDVDYYDVEEEERGMDLIDICERAKEAGIDVEIRIDTDTGHNFGEPFVVIEGCTHPVMGHGRDRYAVRYSVDMLKEAKVAAEDLIKRATDEIIANLCPEGITKEMWEKAIGYLYNLIHTYAALGCHGTFRYELDYALRPLRRRVESGERTRELYDEIMAL